MVQEVYLKNLIIVPFLIAELDDEPFAKAL